MGIKINVDLNDLLDLVNYTREDEENDWYHNGGDETHLVHKIRRLSSRIDGHRTVSDEESNRMNEREYYLYATERCGWGVAYGTTIGKTVYCQEPVKRKRTGTFFERSFCPEHVIDALES